MISHLQPEQLDVVMQIWLETNISAHDFVPASYWEGNVALVRELLPQSDVFVYQFNDTIQGFVGVTEGNYIAGIFVAEGHQSQGIGQALLDYCKARYTSLTLDVYVRNENAIRFYLKNDFSVQQTQLNADTGHHELQMMWKIS